MPAAARARQRAVCLLCFMRNPLVVKREGFGGGLDRAVCGVHESQMKRLTSASFAIGRNVAAPTYSLTSGMKSSRS